MSEQNVWPVKNYRVYFNPANHQGVVTLQLDNDPEHDIKFADLTADDITALLAILTRGAEFYKGSGTISTGG